VPGRPVATRSWQLAPEALSARAARRHVRELLAEAGRQQWGEAAELAVSEVVTNAVLHAHTPIALSALVDDAGLLVEVHDRNPALPAQRSYDHHATTGRGMELVAALATSYGVRSLGGDGKVVWFRIGDEADASPEHLLDLWDDAGPPAPAPDRQPLPPGVRAVVLERMPPTLWHAASEHHDALLRESVLFRAEHPDDPASRSDLALADEARALLRTTLDDELARDAGLAVPPLPEHSPDALPAVSEQLDLVLHVRPGQAPAFAALQDALDAAERLAATDRLLVRPGLPEIVAVRDWACEQVIAQLAGSPGTPWAGADDERFTGSVAEDPSAGLVWDDTAVRTSERGVVAADDANRILAVSAPLSRALGWEPGHLVGRRVVELVPHRHREAHVAGFSRHLSTGDARVLGTALDLPVLRADGSEVVCAFLIESDPTAVGRHVYLAWITPPG